jgi:hypothetical protein
MAVMIALHWLTGKEAKVNGGGTLRKRKRNAAVYLTISDSN